MNEKEIEAAAAELERRWPHWLDANLRREICTIVASALPPLRAREEIARVTERIESWRNDERTLYPDCEVLDFCDLVERALSSTAGQEWRGPKWRHVKRGSVVTEIARGFAQVAHHPIEEMTAVVIYRHDGDGRWWVRNAVEFDDGRFIPAPPVADSKEQK